MNYNCLILLLGVLLLGACADTVHYEGRGSLVDFANECATCGASVSDDYFAASAFSAMGPGSY